MELTTLLTKIKSDNFAKILVTGPGRTGTRLASKILSHELKMSYIDQIQINNSSLNKLFSFLFSEEPLVIQCPGWIALICHMIDYPKTAIVYMMRNLEV